jgi:hypothetical protein
MELQRSQFQRKLRSGDQERILANQIILGNSKDPGDILIAC